MPATTTPVLGESIDHGLAAQHAATEIEHQQWETSALCMLGEAYVAALAPENAIEVLEDAFGHARQMQSAWWTGLSASNLALAYLLAGNRARAESTLRAAWPRDHAPTNRSERRVAWVWGELALADRKPQVALQIAEGLLASVPGGTRGQGIPVPAPTCAISARGRSTWPPAATSSTTRQAGAL